MAEAALIIMSLTRGERTGRVQAQLSNNIQHMHGQNILKNPSNCEDN